LALGRTLRASGHAITIAITQTERSARRASRLLATGGVSLGTGRLDQLTSKQQVLLRQSELIIIATPDDAIPGVAGQIATLFEEHPHNHDISRKRTVVLHTSGALASDVLKEIRAKGLATGSLHPLISMSGSIASAPSFSGVYFSLEGDAAAIRVGRKLVRDLGGNSFVIDAHRKPLYHASALMASPNLTALIDLAVEMMSHCGFSSSEARKMLLPLIVSTVDNLRLQDAQAALTGTFKRGDIATAKIHLEAIASERLTDAMEAYVTLGKRSLALSDISKIKKREIESLLTEAMTRSRRR
jgi:predicted short-subunit dehydrogenase-like oxidoreductase (DUF2520 family)